MLRGQPQGCGVGVGDAGVGEQVGPGPAGRVDGVAVLPGPLERDGLVHRDAQPVIPPRVDYSLTARGRELATLLLPLVEWMVANAEDILGPG